MNITVFICKMRPPFGNRDWREIKLGFVNLTSLMGSDIPRPSRNFRNEGLSKTRLSNPDRVREV